MGLYRGYVGIMENEMETTTIIKYRGYIKPLKLEISALPYLDRQAAGGSCGD